MDYLSINNVPSATLFNGGKASAVALMSLSNAKTASLLSLATPDDCGILNILARCENGHGGVTAGLETEFRHKPTQPDVGRSAGAQLFSVNMTLFSSTSVFH